MKKVEYRAYCALMYAKQTHGRLRLSFFFHPTIVTTEDVNLYTLIAHPKDLPPRQEFPKLFALFHLRIIEMLTQRAAVWWELLPKSFCGLAVK